MNVFFELYKFGFQLSYKIPRIIFFNQGETRRDSSAIPRIVNAE